MKVAQILGLIRIFLGGRTTWPMFLLAATLLWTRPTQPRLPARRTPRLSRFRAKIARARGEPRRHMGWRFVGAELGHKG